MDNESSFVVDNRNYRNRLPSQEELHASWKYQTNFTWGHLFDNYKFQQRQEIAELNHNTLNTLIPYGKFQVDTKFAWYGNATKCNANYLSRPSFKKYELKSLSL